jgi:hypothetical protein
MYVHMHCFVAVYVERIFVWRGHFTKSHGTRPDSAAWVCGLGGKGEGVGRGGEAGSGVNGQAKTRLTAEDKAQRHEMVRAT